MDIRIPVELPSIDLSAVLPLLALVVLAALIVFALVARSVIQSRALALIVIAAIIVLGSSTIVGSLNALIGLLVVAGVTAIGLVIVLGRNPDVLDLLQVVAKRNPSQLPSIIVEQHPLLSGQRATPSLPEPPQPSSARRRVRPIIRLPRDSGF